MAVVISTVTTLSGKTEGILGRGGARTDGDGPGGRLRESWVGEVRELMEMGLEEDGKTEGILSRGGARTDGDGPGGRWEDGGNPGSGRCEN